MGVSQANSTIAEPAEAESMLAKPLAPEEIRKNDFVSILHVTYELPSFWWCAESYRIPHDQPVRLQFLPADGGTPLKVRAVCLPFILVKTAAGEHRTIDVRKCRLARLDRRYAKVAWKVARKATAKPAC